MVWTVGLAPRFRGHGSDFITRGDEEVPMVSDEDVVDVVASLSMPFWVNWANCCEVRISGAFGTGSVMK
jgi:hypothetical protein